MGRGKIVVTTIFILFIASMANGQTYATGNYIGNGTSKAITGLGFSPECIMIKSNNAYEAVICHTSTSTKTKRMGTTSVAMATGNVSSLDSDGFTVGSGASVNTNAVVYQYIAWNESTNIHVGTYTGNGATGTASGCGFQPDAFILWGDQAAAVGDAQLNTATQSGGAKSHYLLDGSDAGGNFSSFNADGFSYSGGGPITNAVTYYYIAFNNSGTTIKEGQYSCGGFDNTSDRTFTDMGFQPDFLMVYAFSGRRTPVFRIGSVAAATDKSFNFTATAGSTGGIKAFTASEFTAGANNNQVMVSWQTQHYYLATSGGTALPVQLTSFEAQKDGSNVFFTLANWF
jgi:hypothetical protein